MGKPIGANAPTFCARRRPARYVERVLLRILVSLLALQLVDLILLIVLSRSVGFWPTILGLVLVGVCGSALARRESARVWRSFRGSVAAGSAPEHGIVEGMLVLLGGVLLLLPGILSDVVALALLVPPLRSALAAQLRRRLTLDLRGAGSHVSIHVPRFIDERPAPRESPDSRPVIDTTGVESPE